jgi:mannose-6-phosphate isomerase
MINYQQPFILLPNRVWRTYQGGATLDQWSGVGQPADSHFPEDWVGSATRAINPGRADFPDEGIGQATTVTGECYSMAALYTTDPVQALGAAHVAAYGAQPYLLVKLLDSAMRLHIQAHPSVAWARQHLHANSGKTEAWWILQTRSPDAYVYMGFQQLPTPAAWKALIEAQDLAGIEGCFAPIPVKPGDILLVEGGVPHAIGPGITMIEIQEPTDYVVRCEYAHGGLPLPEAARTMGLGLDKVLDLFDYTAYPVDVVKARFGPQVTLIAETANGREHALLAAPQTDRLELRQISTTGTGPYALDLDGRFSILIVTEGEGTVTAHGITVPVQPWSRLFLPAALAAVQLTGELKLARCLPPTA